MIIKKTQELILIPESFCYDFVLFYFMIFSVITPFSVEMRIM